MKENIHPIFNRLISRRQQEQLLNQEGTVLWFTGLSGSGKSTIAEALEKALYTKGCIVKVLDGDNIRSGLNSDLGFSIEDREENIRRISEVAKLFVENGTIVLCSFVSPTNKIRQRAQSIIGIEDYNEVYVKASLQTCESRDVKGLYKKARAGEIKGFTGIDSPFDIPQNPELILDTEKENVEENVKSCLELLKV